MKLEYYRKLDEWQLESNKMCQHFCSCQTTFGSLPAVSGRVVQFGGPDFTIADDTDDDLFFFDFLASEVYALDFDDLCQCQPCPHGKDELTGACYNLFLYFFVQVTFMFSSYWHPCRGVRIGEASHPGPGGGKRARERHRRELEEAGVGPLGRTADADNYTERPTVADIIGHLPVAIAASDHAFGETDDWRRPSCRKCKWKSWERNWRCCLWQRQM